MVVVYHEIIADGLLAQEGMTKSASLVDQLIGVQHLGIRGMRMVIAESSHRHQGVYLAHSLQPLSHTLHIGFLPLDKLSDEEDIAQKQGIQQEKTQHIAPSIEHSHNLVELGKRLQGFFLLPEKRSAAVRNLDKSRAMTHQKQQTGDRARQDVGR